MAPTLQIYEQIRQLAPEFARFTQQAADKARNEAEFARQMNNEIERLAQKLGVQLLVREQYTLAAGRADAVYNRLVIEYEPSNSLRALSAWPWPIFLQDLRALLPFLLALVPEQHRPYAAASTFRALQDISRWWP